MVRRVVLAVVGTNVVLISLFALTYAIPDAAIIENVHADSQEAGLGDDYPAGPLGGELDGYTQCLGLTSGVLPPDTSISLPMQVSMVPRGPGSCGDVAEAFALLADDGPFADPDTGVSHGYVRYWSGYSIISRPALAVGGLQAVPWVTGGLLAGASGLLAWGVYRRVGGLPAGALVGTYLLTTNTMGLPLAFTQGIAEATLLAGAAAIMLVPRGWVLPAAAAAASTFVFVDLLTVPGSAWALSVFAVALRAWSGWSADPTAGRPWSRALTASMWGATVWTFGYCFTWGMRWIVAIPFFGAQNVFDNVFRYARFRIDGDTSFTGAALDVSTAPFASVIHTLDYWRGIPGSNYAVVVLVIALVALWTMRHNVAMRGGWATMAALTAPALLVPLWLEVLKNHSQIHAFFTHRSLGMAFAIGVAAMAVVTAGRRPADEQVLPASGSGGTPLGEEEPVGDVVAQRADGHGEHLHDHDDENGPVSRSQPHGHTHTRPDHA